MTDLLEQRLTDLEVRFAFVDDMVQTLNTMAADQDRVLFKMRQEFERLRQDLDAIKTGLSHDAREEAPPPHY